MNSPAPDLTLVHEDEALLVLDKPAGLLSVPGRGPERADCLSARAQARWPDALVVHRLDQATSGLLVMARGALAQRRLSLAFAERQVHKRYQAVVAGRLSGEDWGEIELPLVVDWPRRPRSKVCHETGKPSLTRWCAIGPVARTDGLLATRLWLEPVTGRSHQLRLHLSAIGHPILGDELYADGWALAAAPRLLLHACEIALPHPLTGERLQWRSACPF